MLAVEVKDEPGALSSLIAVLGDKDVNVEYMYALTNRIKGVAYMIIRPNDQAKAIAALDGAPETPVPKPAISMQRLSFTAPSMISMRFSRCL